MYIPKYFAETRLEVLDSLMRRHPLASLVTTNASGLTATSLPLHLHRIDESRAVLRGHMARANGQWREFDSTTSALAIFTGPEHYISPRWYADKQVNGKVVPTWNYAVVHAHGALRVVEDSTWLLEHLNALVDEHEAAFESPWSVADAPADYIAGLLKGIVGIELTVDRLEGKWKASQNQSEATRAMVVDGLAALGTESGQAMSSLVKGERD